MLYQLSHIRVQSFECPKRLTEKCPKRQTASSVFVLCSNWGHEHRPLRQIVLVRNWTSNFLRPLGIWGLSFCLCRAAGELLRHSQRALARLHEEGANSNNRKLRSYGRNGRTLDLVDNLAVHEKLSAPTPSRVGLCVGGLAVQHKIDASYLIGV